MCICIHKQKLVLTMILLGISMRAILEDTMCFTNFWMNQQKQFQEKRGKNVGIFLAAYKSYSEDVIPDVSVCFLPTSFEFYHLSTLLHSYQRSYYYYTTVNNWTSSTPWIQSCTKQNKKNVLVSYQMILEKSLKLFKL